MFTVGEKAAAYFGLEHRGPDVISVPDAAEVAGAFRAVDRYLAQKGEPETAIKFCEPESRKMSDYLRRFADSAELPIDSTHGELAHDVSYHMVAAFIPKKWVDVARARVRLGIDFIDFLEANRTSFFPSNEAAAAALSAMRLKLTKAIDQGTANLTIVLMKAVHNPEYTKTWSARAANYIKKFVGEGVYDIYSAVPEHDGGSFLAACLRSAQVEGVQREVPGAFARIDQMIEAARSFEAKWAAKASGGFDPRKPLPATLQGDLDHTCSDILARLQRVREAGEALVRGM
jgi:hypothetical protein